ncbi:MAG: Ribonuclease [Nevskia sp.]|nr:Ribonuclease [Nevskia sp.]
MAELIAGIDEVGRGCLAGPVYAAAVILPMQPRLRGLRDSKALTAAAREQLVPRIEQRALAWAIGIATPAEIDEINILQATLLAMRRALAALPIAPQACLVDGNQNPQLGVPTKLVIGGDALHDCIMAASIVAKVARDAEMRRLCAEHPQYGFSQHKGYGTPEHLRALQLHGPCAIHRRSFAPCAQRNLQFIEMPADGDAMLEPVDDLTAAVRNEMRP